MPLPRSSLQEEEVHVEDIPVPGAFDSEASEAVSAAYVETSEAVPVGVEFSERVPEEIPEISNQQNRAICRNNLWRGLKRLLLNQGRSRSL